MARTKIPISVEMVEALASQGLTLEQVADNLNIDRMTLFNRRKEDPAIEEAYNRGRSKGIKVIANALFEEARKGNTTAQIFFLKCHGWSEQNRLDVNLDVKQKSVKEMSDEELKAELVKYGDKS